MIFAAAFDGDDNFVARQKFTGYVDGLIQQSTRVIAEVENQLAHALFFQAGNCLAQLVIAGVLKSPDQSDVARSGRNHKTITNRGQRHGVAHDLDVERYLFTGTLDFQQYFLAALTANIARYFFAGPIARVLAVDFYDAVAIAEPGARSRSPLDN